MSVSAWSQQRRFLKHHLNLPAVSFCRFLLHSFDSHWHGSLAAGKELPGTAAKGGGANSSGTTSVHSLTSLRVVCLWTPQDCSLKNWFWCPVLHSAACSSYCVLSAPELHPGKQHVYFHSTAGEHVSFYRRYFLYFHLSNNNIMKQKNYQLKNSHVQIKTPNYLLYMIPHKIFCNYLQWEDWPIFLKVKVSFFQLSLHHYF